MPYDLSLFITKLMDTFVTLCGLSILDSMTPSTSLLTLPWLKNVFAWTLHHDEKKGKKTFVCIFWLNYINIFISYYLWQER